jgi:hypothetical protein
MFPDLIRCNVMYIIEARALCHGQCSCVALLQVDRAIVICIVLAIMATKRYKRICIL